MKFLFKFVLLASLSLLIHSCHTNRVGTQYTVSSIAERGGFVHKLVKGGEFWLTTYQKITNKSLPYVFYIEGDGLAFISKYKISDNPTPIHPTLLTLAALDPRPNVVYIARPCQYTPMNLNPLCTHSLWTDRRMSEEVVDSINAVVSKINGYQPFSLVGYSGGGGIAVLIAARNKMVKNIITVAGNLDHVSFNKHHNVKPMLGSLNPIDYAKSTANIPQLHATGAKDKIMPAFIADKFVRLSNSPCVHQEIFSNVDHTNGWKKIWPYILEMPLVCYVK